MSFTYDPATDDGMVRLLITDTISPGIFSDAEITAFMNLTDGVILRAAAHALDTISTSEVLVQKRIRLLDLQTDGPAEAAELRKRVDRLMALADRSDAAVAIDFAQIVYSFDTWGDGMLVNEEDL